ncbi:hypothetical protein [uncultured Paracoccus sp.]|uniref:hypothetical protein n=1 Tax=uncultured Paracoccus sp. TaxID=189685 RepID=UPI0025DA9EC2|nr:hypothetical protein [uncultured Paracoccus sp.]
MAADEGKPGKGASDAARMARQAENKARREARRAERQQERAAEKSARQIRRREEKGRAAQPETRAVSPATTQPAAFNILILGQRGRLEREAAIFAASLRRNAPDWQGQLIVAEPQPEGAWQGVATRIQPPAREVLESLGAQILPFTARHFGRAYPYGNKIEALALLPPGQPFIFFDSDTLVTGALDLAVDFDRPTASMQREGSWPEPPPYGPGYAQIWRSLYDRFGLDFESSLDLSQPDEHWERYLYFNAGWFLGPDPAVFGQRFLEYALAVRDDPGDALACQSLDPWLDQVVLPLVVHSLGGGRPGPELAGLDGDLTCHYRNLSLLYARGSDQAIEIFEEIAAIPEISRIMQGDNAYDALFRQRAGRDRLRPMFQGKRLPSREQVIRQMLRRENLWFRR